MKQLTFFTLFLCLLTSSSWAQVTVTGMVTDDNNEPLISVTVVELGTTNGTITDLDGMYSLTVPDNADLVFSLVGYQEKVVPVNSQSLVNVTLSEGVALDEVVVTALGISKEKKALGYSVTEVGGEEFTKGREINIGNALAGKVAGVNVSGTATGPAGSTRITIRGNASISGNNQPLFVVDGIPIDNQNLGSAGMWGGSDRGDGLSSFNPDDIESMSVLKGPSAAALYGSRASNGVILITTKKGTKGEGIKLEYNSEFVTQDLLVQYDFQEQYGHGNRGAKPTTQQEAQENGLVSWGDQLDGSSVVQFDGVSRPYSYVGNNLDRFYQTGTTFTNTLSMTAGNENSNMRFSMGNLDNESITPNAGFNRKNFTLNANATFADRVTLRASGQYITTDTDNAARLSDSPGNANYTVGLLPPSINVNDLRGSASKLGANENDTEYQFNGNIFVTNPWWATYQFSARDVKDRLIGLTGLRFDVTDWLFVDGSVGIDRWNLRQTSLEPYGTAYKQLGGMSEVSREFQETNADLRLGVQKDFASGFGFSFLVGGNQMRQKNQTMSVSGNDFNVPFLHTVQNLARRNGSLGAPNEKGINSVYSELTLSYNSWLYLTGKARNDWFSTLPTDNNSILYPGMDASIVVSDLLQLPSAFSFMKLRGGWAQVGGDTDPYQTALTYGLVGQGHLGNPLAAINEGRVPNSQLVPLSSTSWEVGADFRLFNNKLGLDFTYYDQKTEDDILFAGISSTSGYGQAVVNVGEMSNKGVELLLYGTPVRTPKFQWDVSFNIAHNVNEVVSLLDPENDEESIQVGESRTRNAFIQHVEGLPYSQITGFRYLRDAGGNILLDDEGLPQQDGEQGVVPLGTGVHPTTGAISNSFTFGDFNMSVLVDFKTGGSLYTAANAYSYNNGLNKETLEGRETGLGKVAAEDVQDYYSRIAFNITEQFVYDASFAKLRQISLGYSLPQSLIAQVPFLSSATISVVGRNLLLLFSDIPNVDPESTYDNSNAQGLEMFGVPQVRSYGVNVNLRF